MRSELARRSSPLRLVAIAAALCAVGCSLLVNTSERTQCHTNADCEAVNALRGRVCSSGFCVVDVETATVSTGPGNGCANFGTWMSGQWNCRSQRMRGSENLRQQHKCANLFWQYFILQFLYHDLRRNLRVAPKRAHLLLTNCGCAGRKPPDESSN